MYTGLQVQIFILALLGSICFLIGFFSILVDYQVKSRKRTMISVEFTTALLLFSEAIASSFGGDSSVLGLWVLKVSNFLTFFLIYIEMVWLNRYLKGYLRGIDPKKSHYDKVLYALSVIGIVLLGVFVVNGKYYYFDDSNTYVRGPLFAISFVMPLAIVILTLYAVISRRRYFSKHIFISGLTFTILPLTCAIIQAFIFGIAIFDMSIGLSAIVVFALSLIDQNEALRKAARVERLTGLPNPYGYTLEIEKKIAQKEIVKYDALYFDIVRMGQINRKYGNKAGDEAIIRYSRTVRDFMTNDEVLGRLGGNFFVAMVRKERIDEFLDFLSGVTIAIPTSEGEDSVTISAISGVYEIPDNNITPNQLMTNISMAVNIAKNVQKKPYVYLTKELMQEMNNQRHIQEMIPQCMAKKEFIPYYQPKVRLSDMTLSGAEALVRWQHDGELIPPYGFIPLMEQNESICKLDFYMLHAVCSDIKMWIAQGLNPPTISVNFSRKNLGNPILAEDIYNVVKSYEIPLDRIQIEITETLDEYPLSYLQGVVEALHRYGMSAAIDDFGTGSSSIKLLKEVPFDVLKIDKSFIDSITVKDRHILAHIIGLAYEIEANTITEGVETWDQLEVLRVLGCEEIQGFYFDKPLPKNEFEKRLKNPVYQK